ncbi:MAG: CAP domain-containing protein, partial [Heliobacteriaceae bacterium]|nr:CAP domain-containing protein [Heliobacteriaceae bacterium]
MGFRTRFSYAFLAFWLLAGIAFAGVVPAWGAAGLLSAVPLTAAAGISDSLPVDGTISYATTFSPADGSVLGIRRPTVCWQVYAGDTLVDDLQMLLDGQAVPAVFDRGREAVIYTPDTDLASGLHRVEITLELRGYVPIRISGQFSISDQVVAPFAGLDQEYLAAEEAQGLAWVNRFRTLLGLPVLTKQPVLTQSAQAHSNYLQRHNFTGHYEKAGLDGFTGVSPQDRAAYFGYTGVAGEGISYNDATAAAGIDVLMDAPYHRLGHVNPNYNEAGIGFSGPVTGTANGATVINYGGVGSSDDDRVVVYPYPGQTDAKVGWFVAEDPNPLAAYGLDRIYTGYPVSFSVHDRNTAELQPVSAVLRDGAGNPVACYIVDSSREIDKKKHIFLLPEQPLLPGAVYTAEVQARRVTTAGTVTALNRSWSFSTLPDWAVQTVTVVKLDGHEYLSLRLKNGEFPDCRYVLTQQGTPVQEYNAATRYYTRYRELAAGDYSLEVTGSLFARPLVLPVQVTGSPGNHQVAWTPIADQPAEPRLPPGDAAYRLWDNPAGVPGVVATKEWRVTFNQDVYLTTCAGDGIFVWNTVTGVKHPVSVTTSGSGLATVIVRPQSPYTVGNSYILYIS